MAKIHYQDLESELHALRKHYIWWNDPDNPEEDKSTVKTALEDICKRGEAISATLAAYDYPEAIYAHKSNNEDQLISDISTLVLDLEHSFNFNTELSLDQIKEIAYGIADRYGFLSLEDVVLCLNRAKEGFYGDLWRLDVQVIYGFLTKYEKELRQIRSDYHQNLHILGKDGSASYDPANKLQVAWALKDRDIDTRKEDRYQDFKEDYNARIDARKKRIYRKLEKSRK